MRIDKINDSINKINPYEALLQEEIGNEDNNNMIESNLIAEQIKNIKLVENNYNIEQIATKEVEYHINNHSNYKLMFEEVNDYVGISKGVRIQFMQK